MVSVADVIGPVIGLAVGAGTASIKYALDQRARLAEDLWSRRLDPYRQVWALTSQFSRWPRQHPTTGDVARLHERFRQWYYGDGGILMSRRARSRYTYVQKGLEALCRRSPDAGDKPVPDEDYDEIVEVFSWFRSALTEDLESRRKRSIVWSIVDFREDRQAKRDLNRRLANLNQPAGPDDGRRR